MSVNRTVLELIYSATKLLSFLQCPSNTIDFCIESIMHRILWTSSMHTYDQTVNVKSAVHHGVRLRQHNRAVQARWLEDYTAGCERVEIRVYPREC